MTERSHRQRIEQDLVEVPEEERPNLIALAERLERERAVPHPGFRGELRRRLIDRGEQRTVTARIRVAIGAYATSGMALLGLAALGVAGGGPLAP